MTPDYYGCIVCNELTDREQARNDKAGNGQKALYLRYSKEQVKGCKCHHMLFCEMHWNPKQHQMKVL